VTKTAATWLYEFIAKSIELRISSQGYSSMWTADRSALRQQFGRKAVSSGCLQLCMSIPLFLPFTTQLSFLELLGFLATKPKIKIPSLEPFFRRHPTLSFKLFAVGPHVTLSVEVTLCSACIDAGYTMREIHTDLLWV
jgi:hypothetical protein